MADDPKIRAAVAAASKSRGSNFAGAIAALGERLDEIVTEVAELRAEIAGVSGERAAPTLALAPGPLEPRP
jgi:hypothetical protein